MECHGIVKVVLMKLEMVRKGLRSVKKVLRIFLGSFIEVSRMCQGSTKEVSRNCQESFQKVYRMYQPTLMQGDKKSFLCTNNTE